MTLEEAQPMGKDIRRPLFQRIDQYGSTDGRSRGTGPRHGPQIR